MRVLVPYCSEALRQRNLNRSGGLLGSAPGARCSVADSSAAADAGPSAGVAGRYCAAATTGDRASATVKPTRRMKQGNGPVRERLVIMTPAGIVALDKPLYD